MTIFFFFFFEWYQPHLESSSIADEVITQTFILYSAIQMLLAMREYLVSWRFMQLK